jgi:ribosome maturation factor RimP
LSLSNELLYLQRNLRRNCVGGDEKSPLFLYQKMNKNKIINLVNESLEENSTLFLIDLKIADNNSILVVVDGEKGVPLSECIRISRHVEHNLDRDEEDFSLEVTTPNITDPLVDLRQYNKNINRTLKVKTASEDFEGKLIEIIENNITLQWKSREPKPIGKGKITVVNEKKIPLSEIKQAKVKIIF